MLEWLSDKGYSLPVRRLGAPDIVLEHATQPEQYALCGYDREGIAAAVRAAFAQAIPLRTWKSSS